MNLSAVDLGCDNISHATRQTPCHLPICMSYTYFQWGQRFVALTPLEPSLRLSSRDTGTTAGHLLYVYMV